MVEFCRRATQFASALVLILCLSGLAHGSVPHFEEVAREAVKREV